MASELDSILVENNSALMPEINGLQLIQHIVHIFFRIKVIVTTGYPRFQSAILAIRFRAFDYPAKSITCKELNQVVHKTTEEKKNSVQIIEKELECFCQLTGKRGLLYFQSIGEQCFRYQNPFYYPV